ncbi:MAG: hypothetical protein ABIQ57_08770 [Candidatus Kapaibacterium sp.]
MKTIATNPIPWIRIVLPALCMILFLAGCGSSSEPSVPAVPSNGTYAGTFSDTYGNSGTGLQYDYKGLITFDVHDATYTYSARLLSILDYDGDGNGTWRMKGSDSIELKNQRGYLGPPIPGLFIDGTYAYSFNGSVMKIRRTTNLSSTEIILTKK